MEIKDKCYNLILSVEDEFDCDNDFSIKTIDSWGGSAYTYLDRSQVIQLRDHLNKVLGTEPTNQDVKEYKYLVSYFWYAVGSNEWGNGNRTFTIDCEINVEEIRKIESKINEDNGFKSVVLNYQLIN